MIDTKDNPVDFKAGNSPLPKKGSEAKRRFRPEVQGLRALAVLMVVSYHIWFSRVSGGVDIFLLISAFLLTLSFVGKVESGKPLALAKYWLHLFKRLLPAIVIVLLSTLTAVYFLVPETRWGAIISQTWSSLFYFQNWALAGSAVDYYADDHSGASPLQHFWSLSVQGQIFILWPIIFGISVVISKIAKLKYRHVLFGIFGLIFAGSLAFSIYETATNQGFAYFDTRARLWEFALGTLLALALPYINLPRIVRIIAGWIGMVAMLSVGFVLDVEGQFPGFVALWPLASAALIIISGQTGSRFGVDRFLSWKPLTRMGDMSYALYLWHWPILVIYMVWRKQDAVGPLAGSAIIVSSMLLAYMTTRFIEKPIRSLTWLEQKNWRAASVIVLCISLVAAPVVLWQNSLKAEEQKIAQLTEKAEKQDTEESVIVSPNPGALSLNPAVSVTVAADAPTIPSLSSIKDEFVAADSLCTLGNIPASDLLKTSCGQFGDPETSEKRIVVVGNSHSQQWSAPMAKLAKEKNWQVVMVLKGGCRFASPESNQGEDCTAWNTDVLDYVLTTKPDLVYTVGTMSIPDVGQDEIVPGFAEYANAIMANGSKILAMRDNPRFSFNMIECIEKNGKASPECDMPREKSMNSTPPLEALKANSPGIYFLDMTDQFCLETSCPGVIGNTYVYMDNNHITRTYMNSLTPVFKKRFNALDIFGNDQAGHPLT